MRRRHGTGGPGNVEDEVRRAIAELTETTEIAEDAWLRINERAAAYERRRPWWPLPARPAAPSGGRLWRLTSATLAVALTAVLVATFLARSDDGGDDLPEVATGGRVEFASASAFAPPGYESVSIAPDETVCEAYHYEDEVLVCDEARGSVELEVPAQRSALGTQVTVATRFGRPFDLAASGAEEVPSARWSFEGADGTVYTSYAGEQVATSSGLSGISPDGSVVEVRAHAEVPVAELTEFARSLRPTRVEAEGPLSVVVATEDVPAVTMVLGTSAGEANGQSVPASTDGASLDPAGAPGEGLEVGSAPYDLVVVATEDAACTTFVSSFTSDGSCEPQRLAGGALDLLSVSGRFGQEEERRFLSGLAPRDAVAVRVVPEDGEAVERPTVGAELRAPGRFFLVPVTDGPLSVAALDDTGRPIGREVTIDRMDPRAMTHHFTGEALTVAEGTAADGRAWELVTRPTDRGFCFGLASAGEAVPDRCVADDLLGTFPNAGVIDPSLGVLVGVVSEDTDHVRVLWSDRSIEDYEVADIVDGRASIALSMPNGVLPQLVGRYTADGERLGQVDLLGEPAMVPSDAPAPDAEPVD